MLKFNAKLQESPEKIAGQLSGYVTKAQLSANGKELTLTLSKPYRIRQFTSNAGIGIDVVGAPEATPLNKSRSEAYQTYGGKSDSSCKDA